MVSVTISVSVSVSVSVVVMFIVPVVVIVIPIPILGSPIVRPLPSSSHHRLIHNLILILSRYRNAHSSIRIGTRGICHTI